MPKGPTDHDVDVAVLEVGRDLGVEAVKGALGDFLVGVPVNVVVAGGLVDKVLVPPGAARVLALGRGGVRERGSAGVPGGPAPCGLLLLSLALTGFDEERSVVDLDALAVADGVLHQHGLAEVPVLPARVAQPVQLQPVLGGVERLLWRAGGVGWGCEAGGVAEGAEVRGGEREQADGRG